MLPEKMRAADAHPGHPKPHAVSKALYLHFSFKPATIFGLLI